MQSGTQVASRPALPGTALETRIAAVGEVLAHTLAGVIDALPGGPLGSAELARILALDKVLTSRVVKAARTKDPLAVLYVIPGPEPLRRLLRAASKRNISANLIDAAAGAVEQFDTLIRREAGDRSALNAMISAWLPEVRAEFELRRKQTAFRAMSELKGAAVNINLATVLLHPSEDGEHLDVVWLFGLLGLRRLRPGSRVKFATRRVAQEPTPRRPSTLTGEPVAGLEGLRLDEFCSVPAAELDVHQVGEIVHYTLADNGFGPRSATDLVFAEVNRAELARYVPRQERRKRHLFAEVMTPSKVLLFDALLCEDVLCGAEPGLFIYDTAFDGIADVNDPARNIDRMNLCESIQPLGSGISKFRTAEVPRYAELLRYVCAKLDWDGRQFRGYRCRIDYPIYGTQVSMAFDAPAGPDAT
jgi:hypothetical protein